MPDINLRAAIGTSDAIIVFNVRIFARSKAAPRQAMRPHVLRPPRQSTGDMTLHGYLKRVEVAVALVSFLIELAKAGDGTNAIASERRTIFAAVEPNGGEQPVPLAALVRNLADKPLRQHMLDSEVPVFEVSVPPVRVPGLRRE